MNRPLREDPLNPGSGFIRPLEQGCVIDPAFSEPGLQVSQPLVLRVVVLTVQTGNHSGELVACEDKPAVGVMIVDEHAHRLE